MMESADRLDEDHAALRPENLSIRTLYKFRTWDPKADEHGQDILKQNILFFSSVRAFNDPLEARIPIRYDLAPKEYILDLLLRHVKDDFPELTDDEQLSLCHTYIAQEVHKDPGEAAWRSENHHRYSAKNFGIASLSEELDNVVLWSHYSDKHFGYCVGLNVRSILEHRRSLARSGLAIDLYKVRYLNRMPKLIPSELSDNELIVLPLTTKSNNWMYEKEFRLISLNGRGEMGFPDEWITKVVLGYNMTQQHRDEIIAVLVDKHKTIPLFESVLSNNSFNLNFQRLDY